jgi:hypothetical protein
MAHAHIWPHDVVEEAALSSGEPMRRFHCLLLTPFSSKRFEDLARAVEQVVRARAEALLPTVQLGGTLVERLDWVNAAGAIQHQIWERIAKADLIFCDVTGQNPNVMFESGVCAALKKIEQVVFLRDEFYRPDQPFDIAPFRFVTYSLTSDGLPRFGERLVQFIDDAVVPFPDRPGDSPILSMPLEMDFSSNRDDRRLLTPPLAHRRVKGGRFEFGSLWMFPHSWATIGKHRFSTLRLSFSATFAQLHPEKDHGYIGVGVRSHHFYAGFGHIVYLNRTGEVMLAQPDESANGYTDIQLRGRHPIEPSAEHRFEISLTGSDFSIRVDDVARSFALNELPKLLGPGLIRFQSHLAWMGISQIRLEAV